MLETGLSQQIKPDFHVGIEGQTEKRDLRSVAAGEDESNRCQRELQISQSLSLEVENALMYADRVAGHL